MAQNRLLTVSLHAYQRCFEYSSFEYKYEYEYLPYEYEYEYNTHD